MRCGNFIDLKVCVSDGLQKKLIVDVYIPASAAKVHQE